MPDLDGSETTTQTQDTNGGVARSAGTLEEFGLLILTLPHCVIYCLFWLINSETCIVRPLIGFFLILRHFKYSSSSEQINKLFEPLTMMEFAAIKISSGLSCFVSCTIKAELRPIRDYFFKHRNYFPIKNNYFLLDAIAGSSFNFLQPNSLESRNELSLARRNISTQLRGLSSELSRLELSEKKKLRELKSRQRKCGNSLLPNKMRLIDERSDLGVKSVCRQNFTCQCFKI